MLKELLKQVKEMGGAFIAPPLTQTEALENNAQGYLIPEDYLQWLKTADGLYWGGLEFFGSKTRQKGAYCITDLLTQNDLYQALSGNTDAIIVGKTDEENFIYNIPKDRYEIRAEFSDEEIKTFPTFQKMISYILNEQIELLENYVAFNEDEEEIPLEN